MNSDKKGQGGEALKKIILRSVGDLPPMPQTVFKVRDIIANPKSNFKELAEVLETD
jgi:HD-like signal output (HDOD) protein